MQVTCVDRQQGIRQRRPQRRRKLLHGVLGEDTARKRIPVCMQAIAGKGQNRVSRLDALAAYNPVTLHDTHNRTGKVEVAISVEVRHFCQLSAQQRAPGLLACRRRAGDDVAHYLRHQPAHADVIQEEERTRSQGENVVDAMVDEVLAHRIVAFQLSRELDLGSDAVGARHEYRLGIVRWKLKEAAKAPDAGEHLGPVGSLHVRLKELHSPSAGVDIYAGLTVG